MKKPKPQGIKPGEFVIALIVITIILSLALIKIYISNKIYYESRKYAVIYHEVSALREENRILKTNIEKLRYKNRVEDTVVSFSELNREKSQESKSGDSE